MKRKKVPAVAPVVAQDSMGKKLKERFLVIWPYMQKRLREASTWRGIMMGCTSITALFGKSYSLPESTITGIIAIGMALVAVLGMFLPDPVFGPTDKAGNPARRADDQPEEDY